MDVAKDLTFGSPRINSAVKPFFNAEVRKVGAKNRRVIIHQVCKLIVTGKI